MAGNSPGVLSVFLGRGLLSQAIRQTIEDFTATGLIRDLVWVDADAFETSSSLVTELRVDENGRPHISRRPFNELVSRSGARKMNLGVINAIDSAEGTLGYAELAPLIRSIDSVCSNFEIHRTNLMLGSVNAPLAGELPILSGYINLMLAPEDSPGPDASTVAYHYEELDHSFVLHCTAGIASVFGLWEGSITAPVTELEAAKGRSFRLVRAFYRHVDGQAVQARLKELILATEDNPLPKINDQPGKDFTAQYTENPVSFAQNAAQELLHEFDGILVDDQQKAVVRDTKVLSSGQAVRGFLKAWWKNMLGTPARAWDTLRTESVSFADDAVQAGIYGTENTAVHISSGFQMNSALAQQRRNNSEMVDVELKSAAELRPVWESFVNTSLSLLDAQPRFIGTGKDANRRPSVVSSNSSDRVVVARRASDVVPGPSSHYGSSLPVEIKVRVDGGEVAPYDVVGVKDFEERLARHSGDGQRSIGAVIGEFQQWQNNNSTSFAYFVGHGLNQRIHRLKMNERELLTRIDALKNHTAQEPAQSKMEPVFRWLGWVSFWSAIVFAATWWFVNLRQQPGEIMPIWVFQLNNAPNWGKWTLFGVWFLIWMLCWILQVFAVTKDAIRLRERRDTARLELETAQANLEITRLSIRRLQVGYQQFLSTSKIVGSLLERPFGEVQKEHEEPLILMNSVPDSVVFAEATPDSSAVEQLARRFRREVFEQGWLQRRFDMGMKEAARILAEDTGSPVNVDHVFGSTGHNSFGDLARLAQSLEAQEFRNLDRSVSIWAEITEALTNDPNNYRSGVLDFLTIYREGKKVSARKRSSLEQSAFIGTFNGEIATELGRVHGILELDPKFCTHEPHANVFDSIGLSEVLLQVSGPAYQEDIAFNLGKKHATSQDLIDAMPLDEDFQSSTDSSRDIRTSMRSPRKNELPGMGEF